MGNGRDSMAYVEPRPFRFGDDPLPFPRPLWEPGARSIQTSSPKGSPSATQVVQQGEADWQVRLAGENRTTSCALRCETHRPAYPRGVVLAQVCGHRVEDAGRFAHRLRRSLQGQSWAEKSLKNGRFLVGFQNLRKPQDAKGTCFPRNSPSRLLEWGSGGRWFESSRPDTRKASWDKQFRLAFFSPLGLIPTTGQTCGQRFDRPALSDTLPRQLNL